MKNILTILTTTLFFLSFVSIQNQLIDYKIGEDFGMKIKGDSNVHKWESSIETLTGTASISYNEQGEIQIRECQVNIPVASIKSSKGKRMDKNTMKALKEKEYPAIEFALLDFNNLVMDGDTFTADAKGNLTITGATKEIDLKINGSLIENGSIKIQCSKDLKMTDFGIKPPTALLGTMRTKDDITIEFNITLNNSQL